MDEGSLDRREYVSAVAGLIAASIAGCGADGTDDGTATRRSDAAPTSTPTRVSETATATQISTTDGVEPHDASLIVSPDMYPALRERASDNPWKGWAKSARKQALKPIAAEELAGVDLAEAIIDRVGSAGLSYVLDRETRPQYADAVREGIETYYEFLYPTLGGGFGSVTPPASAFFTSVLALDVVQAHLAEETVADLESKCDEIAEWYWQHRDRSWPEARIGAYGVWAAYSGNRERLEVAAFQLLWKLRRGFWSGPYRAGTMYVNSRFAGHEWRNAKMHFMDVLDFAADVDIYDLADREWLHEAHEWLYGYSLTPVVDPESDNLQRDCYTFGDASPNGSDSARSSSTYRGGKFGGAVENAAAWTLLAENADAFENVPGEVDSEYAPTNKNRFLAYVLCESVPSDPDPLPSRVYEEGAWFHEDSHDVETLAGALWNIRASHGHNHPDTNAIHCCAYGEHVLRNVGYAGWQDGAAGYSWDYIHNSALAHNVALVDYAVENPTDPATDGHAKKVGAGIRQGFVADPGPVAWARGDSGPALAGATHLRDFVFVPAQGGANGYWLLLDSITAAAETVHTALHPNSEVEPAGDDDRLTYRTPVGGPYPKTDNEVELSIAYGSEPDSVETYGGVLTDGEKTFVGQYLFATYEAAESGTTDLLTALFPHDRTHEAAEFTRKRGDEGLEIRQGDVIDHVVSPGGGGTSTVAGHSIEADAALLREGGDGYGLSFLKNGTLFRRGDSWFRADDPVTISLDRTRGNIATPTETTVTFGHPGIQRVELDGGAASLSVPRNDFVDVTVPAGTYDLTIVTD